MSGDPTEGGRSLGGYVSMLVEWIRARVSETGCMPGRK